MAPAQHQDKEVILSHTRVRIYWLLNHSEWKLQLCHSSWWNPALNLTLETQSSVGQGDPKKAMLNKQLASYAMSQVL
jgi:hypothetical protein